MTFKFTVSQNGVPLDPSLYTWDVKTKTFTSEQSELILDFKTIDGCTFITGDVCTFITGSYCVFRTGMRCTFDTGEHCTFETEDNCTFDTGYYCSFQTGIQSILVIRYRFWIIDLSDYKKVELLSHSEINFDGTAMSYDEYKYLELVKNI